MSLYHKNVLVTGGSGFIGSHLVDRLLQEEPAKIVVVDNLFLGRRENLQEAHNKFGEKIRFYCQDASEMEAMRRIIREERIEVVYDLAVIPLPASLENPLWCVQQNTLLTTVLCELARQSEFATLIHFSSSEVYGTAEYVPIDEKHPPMPSTPYAASKLAGDQVTLSYAHTFGIDAAILRPFNNYGPRQNDGSYAGIIPIVVNRVLQGLPIEIYGDGEQTRDYIFVGDTVEAAVQMYNQRQTRGCVVNVASGQEITINRLVDALLEVLQVKGYPVVHAAPRPGDVRRHCGDVQLARSLFDFAPKITFEDGLTKTVQWYLAKRSQKA
ncbi:MAG: NAD-dependent epimerase/dehydratase family protein [Caldilinea sp. CFX5]|nr:NAD-dependent epimerase/dehydratase family protein [Caldilinea sp. CFX5]